MNLSGDLSRTDSVVSRRRRMSLFSVVILGVLILGWLAPAVAEDVAGNPGGIFEQHEVALGTAERQTVLTGFLLGGAIQDIAVLNLDENDERHLRIYAFDEDGWLLVLEATLGREVVFVDVANIDGRDRLITYESGRLNWFDPDSETERALVEVADIYNATPAGLRFAGAELMGPSHKAAIPQVDITRDLNRDGLDDLVLPDMDGFWISTQSSGGSFTDFAKLGPPEPFLQELALDDKRTYDEVGISALTIPWYLSRVHEMDYDQDGRSDLVFWSENHFDVHLQDERGRFDPVPRTFTTDVAFESDGTYSLIFGYGDRSTLSLLFGFGEKTKRTVLHSFRDVDGDGVADLVTLTLEGRNLLRQSSLYEVHFGTPAPNGTLFARLDSAAIQPRGKRPGGLQHSGYSSQWLQDLDGDGQVDLMLRDVTVGIGGMSRALVGNSVPVNLEFYRIEDGVCPDMPTTRRKIRRFAPFAGVGNIFFPSVLVGDVNGDGRSDLLVGRSPEELQVFLGVPGPDLLARQPQKVAVAVPYDERSSWLVDLNRDGMQDLVMHHAPTGHEPKGPQRLTVLVAR